MRTFLIATAAVIGFTASANADQAQGLDFFTDNFSKILMLVACGKTHPDVGASISIAIVVKAKQKGANMEAINLARNAMVQYVDTNPPNALVCSGTGNYLLTVAANVVKD